MNKNKLIYTLSFILASIVTNIMCIFVTYQYTTYELNPINSAPSYVTLIYSIPFLLIIMILLIIGTIFYKKEKKNNKE